MWARSGMSQCYYVDLRRDRVKENDNTGLKMIRGNKELMNKTHEHNQS